jgi:excisionase family DNA binding protein
MNGRLLTIDQVAEYMGVHRDTVYSLIKSGRLPALQLGGRKAGWRITEDDVTQFVSQGKAVAASETRSEEEAQEGFERRQSAELQAFLAEQRKQRESFNADGGSRAHSNGSGIRQ